jgi:hypothetical protein
MEHVFDAAPLWWRSLVHMSTSISCDSFIVEPGAVAALPLASAYHAELSTATATNGQRIPQSSGKNRHTHHVI